MKTQVILILLLVLSASLRADYKVAHLESEDPAPRAPFGIVRVQAAGSLLRIFLSTRNLGAVVALLESGGLIAQVSEHSGDDAKAFPARLTLGKGVVCQEGGKPTYLAYDTPLPMGCGAPVSIEFYFETSTILGPGRDLAIGWDPHHLWLIEWE